MDQWIRPKGHFIATQSACKHNSHVSECTVDQKKALAPL